MRTLGSLLAVGAAALWLSLTLTAQSPQVFTTATGQRIQVTQIAGGLVHPYSIASPTPR